MIWGERSNEINVGRYVFFREIQWKCYLLEHSGNEQIDIVLTVISIGTLYKHFGKVYSISEGEINKLKNQISRGHYLKFAKRPELIV